MTECQPDLPAGRSIPVTFVPDGVTVWVERGTTILEAARLAGVGLTATCGGRGVCGTCGVRIDRGVLTAPNAEEATPLDRAPANVRLACSAEVEGPITARTVTQRADGTSKTPPTAPVAGPLVAGIDLGTTYVSAVLVERETSREVGRASVPNAQSSFGADVLSRIAAAESGDASELAYLAQRSIVDALRLARGARNNEITDVVIAGNSAMTTLLTETDPAGLARAPFRAPEVDDSRTLNLIQTELGSTACVTIVPALGAFVGGDVLAGLVGLGVPAIDTTALLVDIGTNTEVALWHNGHLTVASAPAGPAFEGVGITSGGPAVTGAVTEVSLRGGRVVLTTIDSEPARWFSGSGIVSAMAMLKCVGHLYDDGTLVAEGPLRTRFSRTDDDVLGVDLGDGIPLRMTQLDIRAVQLAKAATRVAIEGVLAAGSVSGSELERVWIAGAFGAAMSSDDLVSLGIVPASVRDRLEFRGNTSLAGALALAFDPEVMESARGLLRGISIVDLPSGDGFSEHLMKAVELSPYDV